MNFKKIVTQFDYVLIGIVILIFILGMLSIASATDVLNDGLSRQVKMQAISFVMGLLIILIILLIDYEVIGNFYKAFYVLGLVFILLVHVPGLGVERLGAYRWISLGPIDIQTSEIAKIFYIVFFAKFLEKINGVTGIKEIIKCTLVMLPYFILVFKQPDLGTSLVFVSATAGMMFVAGLKYRYIVLALGTLVASAPFVYPKLGSHQRVRIDAFLNPEDLTLPGNYHVMQSKITIGSGQMYGKGLFEGVYHRLNYLPVQDSDFIFAVFVEETGFVGGVVVIALYFLFLARMIYLSQKIKDDFGAYMIIGFACMFAFQIIENIAMTMGKMPVTGITLPFFSYGSTSLVTSLIAVGIVESIYIRRKKGHFNF